MSQIFFFVDHAVQLTFCVILASRVLDLILAVKIQEPRWRQVLVLLSLGMLYAPFYSDYLGAAFCVPSLILLGRRWERSHKSFSGSFGFNFSLIFAGIVAILLGPNPFGFALYAGAGLVLTGIIGICVDLFARRG